MLLFGCEKDLELNGNNLPKANLKNYLATYAEDKIADDLFAFAGKSPFFENETPGFPVHIYAIIPDNAVGVRIYSSDSTQFPDSLDLFTQIDFTYELLQDGFFTRFIDNDTLQDKVIRISYQNADSLHISIPIELKVTSRSSSRLNGIIREINSQDYLSFDWSSVPATEFHFLTMSDPANDLVFALLTRRSDFSFYDIRFTERVLFQAETRPQLQPNYQYRFSVFSISSKGWLNASANNTFTAE